MSRLLVVTLLTLPTLTACPRQAPPDPGTPGSDASPAVTPTAEAAPPAVDTQTPPATASATREAPMPDPITHPCVVTAAQFDIAFRDGDKSCAGDADCVCIPMQVGSQSACGGVTSKKTNAQLLTLEKEFRKDGCSDPRKCAQKACQPKCVSGQCQ